MDEPFNFPPEFERTLPTPPLHAVVEKKDTPNMNSDAFAKITKETAEVDNINADNIDRSFHDLTGKTAGSFIQELVNNGGLANVKRNVDEPSKRDAKKQTQTVNKRRARTADVNNKNRRARRDSKTRSTRRQTREDSESSRSLRALRRLRRATETLTGNIKSYAEDIKSMYDMSTEMYDKGTEMYEKMQQMTNNSNGGGGAQSEGCAAKPEGATGAGDTGAAEAN